MIEHGTIVEVRERAAVVELARGEMCAHCNCCVAFGDGSMRLEADAPDDVGVGDRVSVEIPVRRLRAVFLVFVLPLAAVLIGACAGIATARIWLPESGAGDLLAIGGAVVLVALTFLAVARYERSKGARHMRPRVISVERETP